MSSSSPPPLPRSAISLSSPPPTVHVLGRTLSQEEDRDEEEEEKTRRDSLERTRNFYNIPSRTSSSSFNQSSSAYSRPVSPPPRPSSRQNSIRSIHDLSSPQLPLPAALPSTGPSSNAFTSGVLPPRGFFAPQQPRGAQVAAVSSSKKKVEDVELGTVAGGFGRRGAESEDDDLEGDESELEGGGASAPRERRGSRFSLSKGGAGGSSGFTASREPLISSAVAGNGWTDPSSTSSPQTSPFQPPHPHYTTQQPQPQQRLSPSVQSQPTSPRSNPPPPLSLSPSSHPTNLPRLANSPNHQTPHPAPDTAIDEPSHSPSTPFTPPPTPSTRKHKKTYNYQLHDSRNTFFLRGKLLTGGDSSIPFIISLALVLGLGGLWLGTTGVWIWREGVGGNGGRGGVAVVIVFAWVWGVALGGMFGTAFRDPGIIPRNLDLAPPLTTTASTNSLVPLPRDIRVRAGRVTVKYCETCRIYRPPRSSHCRVCGNCVDGIDHHCTYLHACVGRRNYTSFMSFLVFTFLALVYTVVFSAIHLWRLTRNGRASNFREALGQNAGSGVSFILGCLFVLPVGLLMGYHLRLMMNNSTTIEEIRRSASQNITPRPPSPFAILLFWRARLPTPPSSSPSNPNYPDDNPSNPFRFKHWYTNFGRMLCRPAVPSWMEFDKEVERRNGEEEEGIGMREHQQQQMGGEKWRK